MPRRPTHAHECLTLAHEASDRWGAYMGHDLLGYVASAHGDYERARVHFEEVTAAGRGRWRPRDRPLRRGSRSAALTYGEGDFARAIPLIERALAIQRDMQDLWSVALSLNSLGVAQCGQGQLRWRGGPVCGSPAALAAVSNKENLAEWLAAVATLAAASRAAAARGEALCRRGDPAR